MKIEIKKPRQDELEKDGVFKWPVWEKEVSSFPWHYDAKEQCYLLEGQVEVETEDGQKVRFGAGDFVTFPEGLSCTWIIKAPVKKHYRIG